MTILTPIALLRRQSYAYYFSSSHGIAFTAPHVHISTLGNSYTTFHQRIKAAQDGADNNGSDSDGGSGSSAAVAELLAVAAGGGVFEDSEDSDEEGEGGVGVGGEGTDTGTGTADATTPKPQKKNSEAAAVARAKKRMGKLQAAIVELLASGSGGGLDGIAGLGVAPGTTFTAADLAAVQTEAEAVAAAANAAKAAAKAGRANSLTGSLFTGFGLFGSSSSSSSSGGGGGGGGGDDDSGAGSTDGGGGAGGLAEGGREADELRLLRAQEELRRELAAAKRTEDTLDTLASQHITNVSANVQEATSSASEATAADRGDAGGGGGGSTGAGGAGSGGGQPTLEGDANKSRMFGDTVLMSETERILALIESVEESGDVLLEGLSLTGDDEAAAAQQAKQHAAAKQAGVFDFSLSSSSSGGGGGDDSEKGRSRAERATPEEHQAATRLSARQRGIRGRARAKNLKEADELDDQFKKATAAASARTADAATPTPQLGRSFSMPTIGSSIGSGDDAQADTKKVTIMQSIFRRKKAKITFDRLSRDSNDATKVQSVFRRNKAKKRVDRLSRDSKDAIKVQSLVRGNKARKAVDDLKKVDE